MTTWYPCGTYLKILTENLTEKSHNTLFGDQMQRMWNILKALQVCINGGFKQLVFSPFITADDLRGELPLWTTTVVLTKICSFS